MTQATLGRGCLGEQGLGTEEMLNSSSKLPISKHCEPVTEPPATPKLERIHVPGPQDDCARWACAGLLTEPLRAQELSR